MLRDHPANERESPSPAVPRSVRIRRMKTTFIGLGNMGLPMARNLLQAGHALVVYNRTPARAQMLKQLGATVADGPAAAARGAEVLITMLGDDDAVEAMVLGDGGALAALPRGAIHISMSTISPALSRRLSERHRASGQTYVAAPVFGRPEAAEAKKLWVVAAGPAPAIERCRPLFDAMGQGTIVAGGGAARSNVVKLGGEIFFSPGVERKWGGVALRRQPGISPPPGPPRGEGKIFRSPAYHKKGRATHL